MISSQAVQAVAGFEIELGQALIFCVGNAKFFRSNLLELSEVVRVQSGGGKEAVVIRERQIVNLRSIDGNHEPVAAALPAKGSEPADGFEKLLPRVALLGFTQSQAGICFHHLQFGTFASLELGLIIVANRLGHGHGFFEKEHLFLGHV